MSDHVKGPIYVKDLISETGATAILSDYKDTTDPKYIGPGTWDVIHRRAFKAQTREQQIAFISFMKDICYGFPCSVCRGHCTEHIKNHPMEEYLGILINIESKQIALGMFVWSWKFHNAVNARIGKPIMSWETAYNLYVDGESPVCSKNCLAAGDKSAHGIDPPATINTPKIPQFKSTIPKPTNEAFHLISVRRKK